MDTVTEAQLAIALAQEGGIGIIHKNMPPKDQARQVSRGKKFESGVIRPDHGVAPTRRSARVVSTSRSKNISGVPVVEGEDLVGIDIRYAPRLAIRDAARRARSPP